MTLLDILNPSDKEKLSAIVRAERSAQNGKVWRDKLVREGILKPVEENVEC